METKEFNFLGTRINGILAIFLEVALLAVSVTLLVYGIEYENALLGILAAVAFVATLIGLGGFVMLEPNEMSALLFFGKYRGSLYTNGLHWVNPFLTSKKMTFRARNLDGKPIKVNDKEGNPILIGLVVVWRMKDAYKALFEVDLQEDAATKNVNTRMNALEKFVSIQCDAALRQVAGQYAYDNIDTDVKSEEITLRSGGDEINEELVTKLSERLMMAGIEVVEARINNLNYAPEIAAAMLRRQQATAVVSAREKIVEGAVSMVRLALDKLKDERIELDEDKQAAMVSNLLVVLCSDESATPVVNAGTLHN